MKLTILQLQQVLNGILKPESITNAISLEMEEYTKRSNMTASYRSVKVDDDIEWDIKKYEIKNLLELYLSDFISEITLEHICDVLEFSEYVEYDSQIADILFLVSNPEINGKNTKDKIRELLEELNS